MFNLMLADLIFCGFVAYLIVDSPKRWPVLLVFAPLFVLANVFRLRQIFRDQQPILSALAIIYGCGFLFGLVWTINAFEWWKLLILPLPLFFSIHHARRFKSTKI